MAGTFTITSVAGSGPSYTLTVSSASGVAAEDHVVCGILGVTTYDGGIYRVTSVPGAFTINITDDVGASLYGKPAEGNAQYYTPTTEKKLSQLATGGYYWAEPQRRDARIIDESLGTSGDLSGPSSSTDNTVGVFDGTTGKTLKEPDAAVDFGGQNITNVGTVSGHVPTTRTISNGTGITGGGDLSANRTLSVVEADLDPANMGSGSATSGQVLTADGGGGADWSAESGLGDVTGPSGAGDNYPAVFDGTTGKVIKEPDAAVNFAGQNITNVGSVAGHVPTTRAINNGTGISGGGDLSADRTLAVDESALDPANMGSGSATVDYVPKADGIGGVAWGPISGSGVGDVSGPASSTDNGVVVFDGTGGKTIKGANAAVDFGGQNISNVGTVAGHVPTTRAINNGTGISGGGDLSADRTLSVDQSALDPANMGSGSATDGYVATADGIGGIAWEEGGGGGGGVSGPGSSTDHALPRWDSTGGDTLLNSGVTLSDADAMVFPTGGSISKPGTGANSQAFGNGATAGGDRGVAVGYNATAPGNYATIVGGDATGVSGDGATAIGFSADAGINSVCIGRECTALDVGMVVIGYQSYAHVPTSGDSWGAIAIGLWAEVGDAAQAGCDAGIAIGYDATVGYGSTDAVAIGYNANVVNSTPYAIAIGSGATVNSSADRAVAIGQNAIVTANSDYAVAVGRDSYAQGIWAIAIGNSSRVLDNYGMAIGDAYVYGQYAIGIGHSALVDSASTNSVAIGRQAEVHSGSVDSVAIGYQADISNSADDAVAIGKLSEVTSSGGIAIGDTSSVTNSNGVAIGLSAFVDGPQGVAIGENSSCRSGSSDSIAIGHTAIVWNSMSYCISIGRVADCEGSAVRAIAIGDNADAHHDQAIALGAGADTTANNRCTIGTIGGSYDVDLEFGKGLGCWGVTPPGTQPAKINDPSGGTTIDAEARTAINAIIDVLEGCGLSST